MKEHAHKQKKIVEAEARKYDEYLTKAKAEHATEVDQQHADQQKEVLDQAKEKAHKATEEARIAIQQVTHEQERMAEVKAR